MPKKKLLLIILPLITVFILGISFWLNYQRFLNSQIESKLELSIPTGTPKSQIYQLFTKEQSVSKIQELYIRLYYILNKNTSVEAGNYVFKQNTPYLKILSGFQDGSILSRVTFIEGWRVEESALYLAKTVNKEFAWNYYLAAKDFEGQLFPDTYFIDANTLATSLVDLQLKTFKDKTLDLLNLNPNLTENEVIVLASILERETNGGDDLPLIAGILIKRYQEGMPLDADATSQYASSIISQADFEQCIQELCEINFWPKTLTTDQLKSESVYNTRGKVGLPPTPISNPSIKSIDAVVKAKNSPYYYYLHDKLGKAYYAVTLDQHIENIQRFL